ncbi:MAG TPA: metallophosphoesterase [Verrucomicrobiae bacterium]
MRDRLRIPSGGRALVLAKLGAIFLLLATARPGVCGDNFEFVVIGDTRPTFESESFRNFERLIPRINALEPALVVNLGDLIYGYGTLRKEKQWDKYEQAVQGLTVPYYQLPGNHDTYSKDARKVYARRFGKFYQSFDYRSVHFVLLDNTEEGKWGYLGPAELEWLKADLKASAARQVFVFLHFPVWEPERVTPRAYEFWRQSLHPLFLSSRVAAVFGGHYHSYGPTREFDGIRYFITGGGGAELRPEYKKSGGEFHFMKVRVAEGRFDVRVVTERGELTDTEADVMGGLRFAARNSSRIGVRRGSQLLTEGLTVSISLNNPYKEFMTGRAAWVFDTSSFSVTPTTMALRVPAGGTESETFTIRPLKDLVVLASVPHLEFDVIAGERRHRFNRELRFIEELASQFRRPAPRLDGDLADWGEALSLPLGDGVKTHADVRSCYDRENLYFAITVPTVKPVETGDGFSDELQLGIAPRLNESAFGGDFLRLGFNYGGSEAKNETPDHKRLVTVPGVRSFSRREGARTTFEISIPLRLLRPLRPGTDSGVVINLSFPVPESESTGTGTPEPQVNSFSYGVRYGTDSLLPVHFIELTLGKRR